MNIELFVLLILIVLQPACCSRTSSYPVIVDVNKIEIVTNDNILVKEINETSRIDQIIRYIDERRSRWCSPWPSTPEPRATLNFHLNQGGKGIVGLGEHFLIAEFSRGKYLLNLSKEEEQEFLTLLEIREEQIRK